MTERIAVVGLACRYPDADSVAALWENVLAGRQAFRRIPDERLRAADYFSADPQAPDRHYAAKAALLKGFEFDRVRFRVAGSTYRSTDMTHWLALDTAARALADAGFPEGTGTRRLSAGVVVGNSLTGEFSRANVMRVRWPYVRRTVAAALRGKGWGDDELAPFLAELEQTYKSPFPEIDEDTLAGGLANTIAGRICNHFGFGGGGYTVDGACSSSLISVATACSSLVQGHLDLAVAGGVDLSIDPFELIGFAKTGALARDEMRVYDRDSNGFWPGEGCGMIVLMREADAIALGKPVYASIVGWGVSSDGKGGITRPEVHGHRLAIDRAYAMAGFGFDTLGYVEGHGTGTAIGDATELRALSEARRAAGPGSPPLALGTVKGNIGHTKAAAGIAGLIKALMAVRHRTVPPVTGNRDPQPLLAEPDFGVRLPTCAEPWPTDGPARAGVSSMGFGGINAHIAIEETRARSRSVEEPDAARLSSARQDCEILTFEAARPELLSGRLRATANAMKRLAQCELADTADHLRRQLSGDGSFRAAVVASTPQEAQRRMLRIADAIDDGATSLLKPADGIFAGVARSAPRVGFLFPGQGAGRSADGGALRRRFPVTEDLFAGTPAPGTADLADTAAAQPRILASSLAALRVLATLGVTADAVCGHSLGELTALHWAGAFDERTVQGIAVERGRIMADLSVGAGAMASIVAGPEAVEPLLADSDIVIAGYNGPRQTVISGERTQIEVLRARAAERGLESARIAVSNAFHSPSVEPCAQAFADYLADIGLRDLDRTVHSTVTGARIARDADLVELLSRQITAPVRYADAVTALAAETDLLIEVGPGRILSTLAADIAPHVPAVSLGSDSPSLSDLLQTVATAYVLGTPIKLDELFRDRFTRELRLAEEPVFLTNPCESAPSVSLPAPVSTEVRAPRREETAQLPSNAAIESSLALLIRLAAERAELPLEAVNGNTNPLDDLHLSSITVGQLVNQACRERGIDPPTASTAFATSTLTEIGRLLDAMEESNGVADSPQIPAGAGPWVRAFDIECADEAVNTSRPRLDGPGRWQLFADAGDELGPALHTRLGNDGLGGGVLLCLPARGGEDQIGLMLAAARAAVAGSTPSRFVVIGRRRSAIGLAKTLKLEAPHVLTTVITLLQEPEPGQEPQAAWLDRCVREVISTADFSEVSIDGEGRRSVSRLRHRDLNRAVASGPPVLTADDVVLVTGGGKGITAECAFSLAKRTGAAIALLGRSSPREDDNLARNLERMDAAGIRCLYVPADVTSAGDVARAVAEVGTGLGTVTAILHGAGRNVPESIANLTEQAFRETVEVKTRGLENVLAAVDAARIRLLVSFGSIIGRAGLRGEAHYATANQWLGELTMEFQQEHPACRCLNIEWSVWAGAGMGERLGVLESLIRDGIEPIPADEGIEMLHRLLEDPGVSGNVVVCGRLGSSPTVEIPTPELPLLRFVDKPQVHYPGVEFVVDAQLSPASDLYLRDHELDGDLLFPAVMSLEAFAQAASVLRPSAGPPSFGDIEFLRPIVIAPQGTTTIRIACLRRASNAIDAVIRSSDTGFLVDHFRATVSYEDQAERTPVIEERRLADLVIPINPADLYNGFLFQGHRFQRVSRYTSLSARSCTTEISTTGRDPWFASYVPGDLLLGDPGSRDAFMHAIQSCVPDATLLPVGVGRITMHAAAPADVTGPLILRAVERKHDGDTYVYDLEVSDRAGVPVETWQGLCLKSVRPLPDDTPWTPPLFATHVERHVSAGADQLRIAIWPERTTEPVSTSTRRESTRDAVSWALGRPAAVSYRPDGKPEVDGPEHVSASHGAGVTLAIAGARPVGCDIETVSARSRTAWADLLGVGGFALAERLTAVGREPFDESATRVWSALECLRKIGCARGDLVLDQEPSTGRWTVLRSGTSTISTVVARFRDVRTPVVLALLSQSGAHA
ncbi:SDR family NAD(P)-dependent oxidoreductase [Actinospica robiniae]|uniref:type I polyketide synthase n=1 Tax=Actinospica robiniae TaxID=304901 RepID=UPI00042843D6|nr:type I polyketide synthase [Actinospica robiniae]